MPKHKGDSEHIGLGLTVRERAFLAALEALTREHGIEIGGCGECGSPWVREMDPDKTGEQFHYGFPDGYLAWTDETDDSDRLCTGAPRDKVE